MSSLSWYQRCGNISFTAPIFLSVHLLHTFVQILLLWWHMHWPDLLTVVWVWDSSTDCVMHPFSWILFINECRCHYNNQSTNKPLGHCSASLQACLCLSSVHVSWCPYCQSTLLTFFVTLFILKWVLQCKWSWHHGNRALSHWPVTLTVHITHRRNTVQTEEVCRGGVMKMWLSSVHTPAYGNIKHPVNTDLFFVLSGSLTSSKYWAECHLMTDRSFEIFWPVEFFLQHTSAW